MSEESTTSVAFRATPQLMSWLDQQADAMGWSRAAVIRFYLDQAMGHDPEASVLRQYMIQTAGQLQMRLGKAMKIVMPRITAALAEAMMLDSSDPEQLERAFEANMDRQETAGPQQPSKKRKKKRRQRRK